MIRRRVTGIFANLLLAHLMVSSELPACANPGGHTGAHVTAIEPAHHHGPGSAVVSPSAPSDAPVPSRCCAAMTSCAGALICADAEYHVEPLTSGSRMRDVAEGTPASSARPPDPPPPKA
jgi:hypothetical protein